MSNTMFPIQCDLELVTIQESPAEPGKVFALVSDADLGPGELEACVAWLLATYAPDWSRDAVRDPWGEVET